jgi:hypothetical protein
MNLRIKVLFGSIVGIILLLNNQELFCQNLADLVNDLNKDTEIVYQEGFFKSTRVINGLSIENPGKRDLIFIISHRFGLVSDGFHEFYGLDESANVRFGLEYGLTDRLMIAVGRSRFNKNFDGYVKYKLIRQKKNSGFSPISLSLFAGESISDNQIEYLDGRNPFTRRLVYSAGMICASKLTERITIQISPAYIHRNIIPTKIEKNDVFYSGFSGRFKITNRFAVCAEYFYWFNKDKLFKNFNSLSVGFEIETGGHVFQLHVSNSAGLINNAYVTSPNSDWQKGDFHIGFNISRMFSLKKNKKEDT